jgi:hypothetical protein
VAGSSQHGSKPAGFIKDDKFLDRLYTLDKNYLLEDGSLHKVK